MRTTAKADLYEHILRVLNVNDHVSFEKGTISLNIKCYCVWRFLRRGRRRNSIDANVRRTKYTVYFVRRALFAIRLVKLNRNFLMSCLIVRPALDRFELQFYFPSPILCDRHVVSILSFVETYFHRTLQSTVFVFYYYNNCMSVTV